MERKPVNSSTIKEVGFDPQTGTLEVLFNSMGLYSYANVPQEVYDRFLASESKGHFFAVDIRACYPCTHLNPKPKEQQHGEKMESGRAEKAREGKAGRNAKRQDLETKKASQKKARKRIS